MGRYYSSWAVSPGMYTVRLVILLLLLSEHLKMFWKCFQICIFLDDVSDTQGLCDFLSSWLDWSLNCASLCLSEPLWSFWKLLDETVKGKEWEGAVILYSILSCALEHSRIWGIRAFSFGTVALIETGLSTCVCMHIHVFWYYPFFAFCYLCLKKSFGI